MISPRLGRFLSATGAILLIAGLFATWHTITRQAGALETASGFETFPRLRVAIIAGALLLLASAVVPSRDRCSPPGPSSASASAC